MDFKAGLPPTHTHTKALWVQSAQKRPEQCPVPLWCAFWTFQNRQSRTRSVSSPVSIRCSSLQTFWLARLCRCSIMLLFLICREGFPLSRWCCSYTKRTEGGSKAHFSANVHIKLTSLYWCTGCSWWFNKLFIHLFNMMLQFTLFGCFHFSIKTGNFKKKIT